MVGREHTVIADVPYRHSDRNEDEGPAVDARSA
jgi:hypothetical protein